MQPGTPSAASTPSRAAAPPLSVVVPCLNAAPFLDACLRSILDQGIDGLELIVVDGGSTDGSVQAIQRHAEHVAWWCSEPDAGPASAVHKGLAHARGELVAVLNADDLYLPGALTAVLEVAARGADWLVGQVDYLADDGTHWPAHQEPAARWTEWLLTVPVCQPGSFWRRTVVERCAPGWHAIRWLWDYELALGLYFDLGLRPCTLERTLALYRLHAGSATVRAPAVLRAEARALRLSRRRRLGPLRLARLRLAWWQRWQRVQVGRALEAGPLAPRLRAGVLASPGLPSLFLDSEAWRAVAGTLRGGHRSPRGSSPFAALDPW